MITPPGSWFPQVYLRGTFSASGTDVLLTGNGCSHVVTYISIEFLTPSGNLNYTVSADGHPFFGGGGAGFVVPYPFSDVRTDLWVPFPDGTTIEIQCGISPGDNVSYLVSGFDWTI